MPCQISPSWSKAVNVASGWPAHADPCLLAAPARDLRTTTSGPSLAYRHAFQGVNEQYTPLSSDRFQDASSTCRLGMVRVMLCDDGRWYRLRKRPRINLLGDCRNKNARGRTSSASSLLFALLILLVSWSAGSPSERKLAWTLRDDVEPKIPCPHPRVPQGAGRSSWWPCERL